MTQELSNDNLQKQLFSELNQRYDNQNDLLQMVISFSEEEVSKYKNSALTEEFGSYSKAQIKFKINDYFNLCSEEYYWYSKKRIDDLIWNSWYKGMNDIYRKSIIIREQWEEEIAEEVWKSFCMDKPTRSF